MNRIFVSGVILAAGLSLAACQNKPASLPDSALIQEEQLMESEMTAVDKAPTGEAAVDQTLESIDQTLEDLPEDDFSDDGFADL